MILVDCDVASTFAKIDRIDLLRKTFPGADIYITNSAILSSQNPKMGDYPSLKGSLRAYL